MREDLGQVREDPLRPALPKSGSRGSPHSSRTTSRTIRRRSLLFVGLDPWPTTDVLDVDEAMMTVLSYEMDSMSGEWHKDLAACAHPPDAGTERPA